MSSKSNKNSHLVKLIHHPLDLMEGIRFVTSPECGAINTFSGTIRHTDFELKDGQKVADKLKPIVGIFYEAYESMAKRQITKIVETIVDNTSLLSHDDCSINKNIEFVDPNCRIYVAVRLGHVPVSESSLVICVSSTGRHFSHKATMFILETIKSQVLIWKKVIYADGKEKWAGESKSEAFWLK